MTVFHCRLPLMVTHRDSQQTNASEQLGGHWMGIEHQLVARKKRSTVVVGTVDSELPPGGCTAKMLNAK